MAVRLDINANVRGTSQVNRLNRGVKNLGTSTRVAAARMAGLETAALRGRTSLAALGTTLRVGVIAGLAAVGFALTKFIRQTFETGNLIESLQIRFQLLFGSVEEGAQAFDELAKFAARVPFSLEQIAQGSGNLAVVSKDAEELARIMEVTGNVAAATGLDFRLTAEQIQRSLAGGIASADIFRERGVRAMLGFQAGVTVSIEATREALFRVFGPGGAFGNATELLAQTLTGQVSLVEDAYFQFRRTAAAAFFTPLTAQIRKLVGDFQTNSEALDSFARRVGEGLGRVFVRLENGLRFIARNWETLNNAVLAFISYRVGAAIVGVTAAFIQMGVAITTATAATGALRIALISTGIGALPVIIGSAVAAIIFFRKEIKVLIDNTLARLTNTINAIRDSFVKFGNVLRSIVGKDPIETMAESAERLNTEMRAINQILRSNAIYEDNIAQSLEQQVDANKAKLNFQERINLTIAAAAEAEAENLRQISENQAISAAGLSGDRFQAARLAGLKIATKELEKQEGILEQLGIHSRDISSVITEGWLRGWREGEGIVERIRNISKDLLNTIASTIIRKTIELAIDRLFEALGESRINQQKELLRLKTLEIAREKALAAIKAVSGIGGSIFGGIRSVLGFQDGGIVPNTRGSTPGRDSVPALLTPGERVIPVNSQSDSSGNIYNTTVNQTIDVGDLNQAVVQAIRTSAVDINSILESERTLT